VSRLVCFCNNVSEATIKDAIENHGCTNLEKVYDRTQAGVGPCGGSCRRKILELIHGAQPTNKWQVPDGVIQALSLFNRRYYWETHEVLEEIWMEETGELKIFYQGVIQAAAALYHVLNNNPKGVIKLADSAVEKLRPFLPIYREVIETQALVKSMEFYSAQSREILTGASPGFDFSALPTVSVKFKDLEK
jgi:bacterioferritin-associated ferredoxin